MSLFADNMKVINTDTTQLSLKVYTFLSIILKMLPDPIKCLNYLIYKKVMSESK